MNKSHLHILLYIVATAVALATLSACSTQKNTSSSRWWHSFNARYNTYYNGSLAYIDGSLEKEKGNKDNFTEMIPLYTVGNKASRELGKSNYETAITKSQKAITQHSIKAKPEWTKKRRKTERDIEWLNRREYNPFIWKAWMLMGRSQFYKGTFDEAAATFSYMSRLFRTQPAIYGKARAWLAKCYIEQDWIYDAEDVIRNMQRDSIDWRAQKEWDYTMCDYYLHTGDFDKAASMLQKVVKHEQRSKQRARELFLLGQVYAAQGNAMEAYKSFKRVVRQNPPYELEFNARIAMTEVMPGTRAKQKISRLKAMARSDKNKDFLDQVYYAMGNVYMTQRDTLSAIAAYEKGNEKATRSGVEKGVLLLHLGDIYWQMERFADARRCYGEAVGMLDKDRKDYATLAYRSKVLDELVPYTDAIHLQDSLQQLARMSEKDRNAAIDRVIEALKKKEKEEKKRLAEEQNQLNQQANGRPNANNGNAPKPPTAMQQPGMWYFYNPTAVNQGKQQFQKQWGKRDNEDDWQRRNKTVVASAITPDSEAEAEDVALNDSIVDNTDEKGKEETDTLKNDPHHREYYLEQIPFSEEQVAASNEIIKDGLFHSGIIFKDKLDNLVLSKKAFDRLNSQFDSFEPKDEVYYHLFLLHSRQGEPAKASVYVDSLRANYPESQWTTLLSDPDYEQNMRFGEHIEDSLYVETYEAFRNDAHDVVTINTRHSTERFPMGAHRDKFLFIAGLDRLNQGDADSCVSMMRKVVTDFPKSDVANMAGMIVKGVEAGKRLRGAKFDISDVWDRRSEALNGEEKDSLKTFSDERNTDFVFLMTYDADSIPENQLLYEMARYNFTNYLVRNFDIDIEDFEGLHRMRIAGFRSYDEALQYARALYSSSKLAELTRGSRNIIISVQNLEMLGRQLSYNDYDAFYDKHFAPLPVNSRLLLSEPVIDPEKYNPDNLPAEKPANAAEEKAATDDGFNIFAEPGSAAPAAPADDSFIMETEPANTPGTPEDASESFSIAVPEPSNGAPASATDAPASSTTVPASSTTASANSATVPEASASGSIAPATQDDDSIIIIDDSNAASSQMEDDGIVVLEEDTTTPRQQINSDIIDVIDEEVKDVKAIPQQEDSDEYFELEGF